MIQCETEVHNLASNLAGRVGVQRFMCIVLSHNGWIKEPQLYMIHIPLISQVQHSTEKD